MKRRCLGDPLFHRVTVYLKENGLQVARGTLVDATLIHAPSSTKNPKKERDPERHQTRKGNPGYVGMKAHISSPLQGTDQECAPPVRRRRVDESGDGQDVAVAMVHQAAVAALRLNSAERGEKGALCAAMRHLRVTMDRRRLMAQHRRR